MRLPKPRQLPSGRWYIQIMAGQRMGRTFDTPEEALLWAATIRAKGQEASAPPRSLTVQAAVGRYIDSKEAVLSPSTVAGYRKMQRNLLEGIGHLRLGELTQERVQRWVNALSREKSPKTVANVHGLLSAVVREYYPALTLHTTLPQKRRAEVRIPTETELRAILQSCAGTRYELPILLAACLGLRQSEVLGLTWDCIQGDRIHIRRAVVMGEAGPVEKGTKTYSGARTLHLPPYLRRLLEQTPRTGPRLVNLSGKAIYSGFCRICQQAGLPHFRFHDLRHAHASVLLAEGLPDKYAMRRMGHATSHMLKTTYQHTFQEREAIFEQAVEEYFQKLVDS